MKGSVCGVLEKHPRFRGRTGKAEGNYCQESVESDHLYKFFKRRSFPHALKRTVEEEQTKVFEPVRYPGWFTPILKADGKTRVYGTKTDGDPRHPCGAIPNSYIG